MMQALLLILTTTIPHPLDGGYSEPIVSASMQCAPGICCTGNFDENGIPGPGSNCNESFGADECGATYYACAEGTCGQDDCSTVFPQVYTPRLCCK